MKNYFKPLLKVLGIFTVILSLSFFSSCFGDDDEGTVVDSCNFDTELNHYNNMIDAFNANPSSATCNNLKNAALDLLDAVEGCSNYDYYYDATQAWLSVDCSAFDDDGDGGNGNGNGGGNGNGNGKATFWTQSDFGCGNITVYISNTSGTISGYYSTGNPGCNAGSSANFNLPPGSYEWTASCSQYNWSGTITINADSCSTMQLTL